MSEESNSLMMATRSELATVTEANPLVARGLAELTNDRLLSSENTLDLIRRLKALKAEVARRRLNLEASLQRLPAGHPLRLVRGPDLPHVRQGDQSLSPEFPRPEYDTGD